MLKTIIIDAYKKAEATEIADALLDLCDPTDNYGWASAGVYCYWDFNTKEILYLGLAIDLTERFKQHNGFYPGVDPATCKVKMIEDYFLTNNKLGFSILVQSPLSQPTSSKVEEQFKSLFELNPDAKEIGLDGRHGIQRLEGFLLEAFRKRNGKLPLWNKMNGSINGQRAFRAENFLALELLTCMVTNEYVAKSTLRELAASATLEGYESLLHAVRILLPQLSFTKAMEFHAQISPVRYRCMLRDKYFEKKLEL